MPRRVKGMFERKGRSGWYIRLYANGGERVRSLGTDYTEACEKARLLQAGLPVAPKDGVTVSDACGRWLESHVRMRRIAKGQQVAAQRVRDYIEPFMGTMELGRMKREDVRAFRLWLESRTKLSVATVGHVLSDLRCMLNWCEDGELLERSVFPRHVMPQLDDQLPDRLTDEEAVRIAALPEPWGFVCRFALGTGLRWGELCRSQAADLKRHRAVGEIDDRWFLEVSHTKSRKVRRVPLTGALLREVRQKVGRLVPYAVGSPGSFALRVRKQTGIAGFHVHQMRHTFACQWLERGGTLPTLQLVMGHATVKMTQRYGGLSDEAVMREALRIGEAGTGTS